MIMEEKAITTKGQPVPAKTRYDSGQELENIKKERQQLSCPFLMELKVFVQYELYQDLQYYLL